LSNKIFPEDLLSSVPGVCNDTSLYEGEAYYVKHCMGCKAGYQRVVQTDTPATTTQVTKMMPVGYQGIHLVGKEPKYIFARTAEQELKQLECEYEEGNIEYPSCQIHDLPVICKKSLDENDVQGLYMAVLLRGNMYLYHQSYLMVEYSYRIYHQRWFRLTHQVPTGRFRPPKK
jgi:hypothetical protein